MSHYTLKCLLCSKVNKETETSTYCTSCGGVLTIEYHKISPEIQYPIRDLIPDPLKKSYTELRFLKHLSEKYDCEIWAKMELQNPSGCFKDRGSYVEVLKALELKADAVCLASTGNMAASVAMYATYFNLPCYVFVPENTSEAKLAQANMFNASIIRVKGDFSTCENLCKEFAKKGNYYLAGDYVFREEGQKSFSYELIEQQESPFDTVLIPVGCGTNFGAIFKGFKEAKEAGLTDRIPQLVAIQPEEASPVVEGIFKREKVIKKQVTTMATAVAAADPIDFHKVLIGIDATSGIALTVTENDILSSLREMSVDEGIFTEPSCALPLAAIKNNLEMFKGKRCLLVLTGTGLKDTGVVVKHALPSPILDNNLDQIMDFIGSGYNQIQAEAFGKPRDTLLAQIKMDVGHQKIMQNYLSSINRKGKSLTSKEMEVLQSLVFNEVTDLEYPVKIIDYDITMRKNGLVHALVTMDINGVEVKSSQNGVGPLDSVLSAIRKESDKLIKIDLLDHHLEILSPGTNSLVVATLTLGYNDQKFQVKAASPDVVEAAINAFIKGLAVIFRNR
jgi:threonine synthase